jgi:Xaa-Pro aminopeptidase
MFAGCKDMEPPAAAALENRKRLTALLPAGSMAVIGTGPHALPCGVDSAEPWPDFYYLTGLREPGAFLILTKERALLFLPPRDALWEGAGEQALGIAEVRSAGEFETVLRALARGFERVLVHAPENPFAPHDDFSLAAQCRRLLPLHPLERLAPLLGRLRAAKHPAELESMRRAGALAATAFRRAAGSVRAGVRGFEVKAEFLHEIMKQGSRGFACPAICAAGTETLTLHWRGDRRHWAAGEVALLDFTVEWQGLCVDMARCLPVGGKFSPEQRTVYDAVARVLELATAALRPGRLLSECQTEVALAIQSELLRMGRLQASDVRDPRQPAPALRRHFMHRAYHHTGHEVHDPVPDDVPLAPGQVLAVEPAIYLPESGYGIRLENTVLITKEGPEVLTGGFPVAAAAIEDLLLL